MTRLIQTSRPWLTWGIGIKRWLFLLIIGVLICGIGIFYALSFLGDASWLPLPLYNLLTLQFLPTWLRIMLPLLLGVVLILQAVRRLGTTLVAPFDLPDEGMGALLATHNRQNRGPNIVAIGGGTGMPGLLRGLRDYTRNITAVVTVADDGGSSGRLRREFGLLPPGDFRNNIAALSRDEALMTKVLQYRFGANVSNGGQSELQGHAFGNLLLAALTGITGSFDEALLAAERVLAMRGRVLPSTLQDVALAAQIKKPDGLIEYVVGESQIPKVNGRIERVFLQPMGVRAYPPALKAILQADLIIMGPGSLYTSILPNLLVSDITEALRHSKAPKLYVCNLATQPGETDNYTVADHVATMLQHIPIDCLDMVLANDNLTIPTDRGGGQTLYVRPEAPAHVAMMTADLVDEERPWRHDSHKLAQAILDVLRTK